MPVSASRKAAFYRQLAQDLAQGVAKIIGNTSYTLAASVSGISVDYRTKAVATGDSFDSGNFKDLIAVYVRIIGPVARTLAARAAAPLLKELPEMRKDLPAWILAWERED